MPTHGSLTKAGKVRSQTPRIESQGRKSTIPRIRNRKNYAKLISNQDKFGRNRRRRRRR
ncbi:30S ribosomal protein S30e [Candidatus Bathyarchaeota archaeon]|nr:30S ribosomal protein S30e [Candidatus Bathyarchaeota archaeon]